MKKEKSEEEIAYWRAVDLRGEQLKLYYASEENKQVCAPFEAKKLGYAQLFHEYQHRYVQLEEEVQKRAVRSEYGKRGKFGLHYYSPSGEDLFISNVKRGRLLKKKPSDNNYDYEYLFDDQDQLICTVEYQHSDLGTRLYGKEFHIKQTNQTLLVQYYSPYSGIPDPEINKVTKLTYNNELLESYEYAYISPIILNEVVILNEFKVKEIVREEFGYENGKFHQITYYDYLSALIKIMPYPLFKKHTYFYKRDEEGKLAYCKDRVDDPISGVRESGWYPFRKKVNR